MKKHKLYLPLLYLLFSFGCSMQTENEADMKALAETLIPLGGNTYLTTPGGNDKVGQDGINQWGSKESVFSVYVKSEKEAEVELIAHPKDIIEDSKITIHVNHQNKLVSFSKEDQSPKKMGTFSFPRGYVRIDLKGEEGTNFPALEALTIRHNEPESNFSFVRDNEDSRFYWGRRGPSVHLTYDLPQQKDFEWFYNEMTIPEGEDPIGSYFMANGFAEGYFGIQVNSSEERRILFSVWSPFNTDNPEEIPEDQRIKLIKKGKEVYTGEFGNEGSGGQSYLKFDWRAGATYKFLNSVRPDGKGNTVYTAYFFAPEAGEWKLIASFSRPKTDTWYKRPHSFLENFIDKNGHLGRKVHYNNQWARDKDGNWTELTKATFTGDDIARRGYRLDYAGGLDGKDFFLQNGGFFEENTALNTPFNREATGTQPEINFTSLQ